MKTNFACFILIPILSLCIFSYLIGLNLIGTMFLILLIDGFLGLIRAIKKAYIKGIILDLKIIHQKFIPFGKYHSIIIFGNLYTKLEKVDEKIINHELVHKYQGTEVGWLLFYYLYVLEFLIQFHISFLSKNKFNLNKSLNYSYSNISFEEEACLTDVVFDYANKRESYSWLKIIFKGHTVNNMPNF